MEAEKLAKSYDETTLTGDALETAQAQAEADADLWRELVEKLEKEQRALPPVRIATSRVERRRAARPGNRTREDRPLSTKAKRRLQREARALAGIR